MYTPLRLNDLFGPVKHWYYAIDAYIPLSREIYSVKYCPNSRISYHTIYLRLGGPQIHIYSWSHGICSTCFPYNLKSPWLEQTTKDKCKINKFKAMQSKPRLTSCAYVLCRESVCITVKWTWYNGRDIFFHITSGRINTWKCVNRLTELFFLNLIIFFNIDFKLTNHTYFMTKNPSFFTIHNKNGVLLYNFKSLSLNDHTPSPISRLGTHCLQW